MEEAQPFSPSKAERDHSFGETTNKNVEWISYPGAWAFYVGLILMSWLVGCAAPVEALLLVLLLAL